MKEHPYRVILKDHTGRADVFYNNRYIGWMQFESCSISFSHENGNTLTLQTERGHEEMVYDMKLNHSQENTLRSFIRTNEETSQ